MSEWNQFSSWLVNRPQYNPPSAEAVFYYWRSACGGPDRSTGWRDYLWRRLSYEQYWGLFVGRSGSRPCQCRQRPVWTAPPATTPTRQSASDPLPASEPAAPPASCGGRTHQPACSRRSQPSPDRPADRAVTDQEAVACAKMGERWHSNRGYPSSSYPLGSPGRTTRPRAHGTPTNCCPKGERPIPAESPPLHRPALHYHGGDHVTGCS